MRPGAPNRRTISVWGSHCSPYGHPVTEHREASLLHSSCWVTLLCVLTAGWTGHLLTRKLRELTPLSPDVFTDLPRANACAPVCVYMHARACKCVHSAFTTPGILNSHKRPSACLLLHSVNRKPLGLTAGHVNPPRLRCSRFHSQAPCSPCQSGHCGSLCCSRRTPSPTAHPWCHTRPLAILSDVLNSGTWRKLCFSILSPGRGNGAEGAGGRTSLLSAPQ